MITIQEPKKIQRNVTTTTNIFRDFNIEEMLTVLLHCNYVCIITVQFYENYIPFMISHE